MARPELTRLEKLQIDCSSAAQEYIHLWTTSPSCYMEQLKESYQNLIAAVAAVDAQMAYERERAGTPPTGGKG